MPEVTNKLRLTLDPKYLSDWVQLDPVAAPGPAAPSRAALSASALLMDGHSTSDDEALDGPPYAHHRPHPTKDPARRPQLPAPAPAAHAPAPAAPSGMHDGGLAGPFGAPASGGPYGAVRGSLGGGRAGGDAGEDSGGRGGLGGLGGGLAGVDGQNAQLQKVHLHAR